MLSCREVTRRCDEAIAAALPLRQRLGLYLHLAMCRHCRRFARQYQQMLRMLARREEPASEAQVRAVMARLREGEDAPPSANTGPDKPAV